MDAVHHNGTSFAIPVQVMYQREHEFLDEKRKDKAEKRVSEMREKNLMPLPEFSDEQILSLDDTIDYPPKGSANPDPGGRYS
jgi:MscS family membrane protein